MTFLVRVMDDIITPRLQELKRQSFTELSKLSDYQGERIRVKGKSFTLSVWKDTVNDHTVRIVVQVYRHWLLGIGRMAAQGFVIDRDGVVRDLKEEELHDFI